VTLAQNPARGAVPANRRALEQTKQALAEANRQLAEQTGKANTLALEKQELQKKLDSLIPSSWNAKNVDATKKALEAANRKLAEQTALTAKLAQDKETLQSRVKTLDSQAQTAAALRAENEVLKKQLAEAKSVSPAAGKAGDVNRQLADAQAQIAALQSDKEILRLETITLEDRVKQLSTPPAATAASTPARTEDAARVKQLERERDDLQKKLDAAQKELAGRKNTKNAAKADELAGQLNALRAQLDVFEAQAVPYTAEELALFKTPDPPLAAPDREAHKGSGNALPPGAATLVADAHRDFAAKRFDQAEEKYQRVLRLDGKNVAALADLAMIQLQMNHLDDAEKNARQALVLAPDDAYSLSILGCVRYEQGKYDDALDILSRAAKLDPQNPEIQNYLGLTLNQKGLRSPAETALRKAIQLDPNYASAHNNLAVIYLTQKPPLVELARWHYEKALAAGLPRNPELEKLLDQNKTAGAGR